MILDLIFLFPRTQMFGLDILEKNWENLIIPFPLKLSLVFVTVFATF